MTLSEIIALPDAELRIAFWKAFGATVNRISMPYIKIGECPITAAYPTEAECWANAPEPEADVWLKVMDEFDNRVELESDCDGKPRASIVIHDARHIHCATVTSSTRSDALRRAVCAVKVFLNQREEANQ